MLQTKCTKWMWKTDWNLISVVLRHGIVFSESNTRAESRPEVKNQNSFSWKFNALTSLVPEADYTKWDPGYILFRSRMSWNFLKSMQKVFTFTSNPLWALLEVVPYGYVHAHCKPPYDSPLVGSEQGRQQKTFPGGGGGGGRATKKKTRKIVLISLYLLYLCLVWKSRGCPLLPTPMVQSSSLEPVFAWLCSYPYANFLRHWRRGEISRRSKNLFLKNKWEKIRGESCMSDHRRYQKISHILCCCFRRNIRFKRIILFIILPK